MHATLTAIPKENSFSERQSLSETVRLACAGNDLSRSFGWGGAFTKTWIKGHKALHKTLTRVSEATPAPLDRWRVDLTVPRAEYLDGKRPYGFVSEDGSKVCHLSAVFFNCTCTESNWLLII